MGKGYNNYMCKKPFHPGSKANIKRAWMAEQKTENEKKKQDELKVQYEKEQDLYNNRALISTESKDKLQLNFMYEAPPGAKRERQKEDDEPEYKFEWQRKYNAPREDYAKGNADIKDQPFGIPVRNVRCIKCHKWGHINTDRECPLFSQASTSCMPSTSMDPLELMRQMREDGYGLKQNVLGHHLNPKAINQQLLPSDESDPEMDFLKSLSSKQKKKLLRKLNKLSKKQARNAAGKQKKRKQKHKESSSSESDEERKNEKVPNNFNETLSSDTESVSKDNKRKSKEKSTNKKAKKISREKRIDLEISSDPESDLEDKHDNRKFNSRAPKMEITKHLRKDKSKIEKHKTKTKKTDLQYTEKFEKKKRSCSLSSSSENEKDQNQDLKSSKKLSKGNMKVKKKKMHKKRSRSSSISETENSSTELNSVKFKKHSNNNSRPFYEPSKENSGYKISERVKKEDSNLDHDLKDNKSSKGNQKKIEKVLYKKKNRTPKSSSSSETENSSSDLKTVKPKNVSKSVIVSKCEKTKSSENLYDLQRLKKDDGDKDNNYNGNSEHSKRNLEKQEKKFKMEKRRLSSSPENVNRLVELKTAKFESPSRNKNGIKSPCKAAKETMAEEIPTHTPKEFHRHPLKDSHGKVSKEENKELLEKNAHIEKTENARVKSDVAEELRESKKLLVDEGLAKYKTGDEKYTRHPDGYNYLCPQAVVEANYIPEEEEYEGHSHDEFRQHHRYRRSPSVKQKYK